MLKRTAPLSRAGDQGSAELDKADLEQFAKFLRGKGIDEETINDAMKLVKRRVPAECVASWWCTRPRRWARRPLCDEARARRRRYGQGAVERLQEGPRPAGHRRRRRCRSRPPRADDERSAAAAIRGALPRHRANLLKGAEMTATVKLIAPAREGDAADPREPLRAAQRQLAVAKAALDARRGDLSRTTQFVEDLEAEVIAAEDAVSAEKDAQAEAIAGGKTPSPDKVRRARDAERDVEDRLDAVRAAVAKIEADCRISSMTLRALSSADRGAQCCDRGCRGATARAGASRQGGVFPARGSLRDTARAGPSCARAVKPDREPAGPGARESAAVLAPRRAP